MMINVFLGLPLVAGLATYLMRDRGAKGFAALAAGIQFLLGLSLVGNLSSFRSTSYFATWIPELGLNWSLAIDGANVLLVLLTPLITLLAIGLVGDNTPRLSALVASLLLLDGFLTGLFLAQNLGLFYIFFEAMLLPALILIAGWAKRDGATTATRFLLFTLVGSLPMLLGVLALAFSGVGGEGLEFSSMGTLSKQRQLYLFFPFLLAFLVKMPIVPFHGWLPDLYRNSPAVVTAVIAALMSKAGTYGLLKVGLTVFPLALREVAGSLAVLAVFSILYGAFAALGAESLKEVLAYSSLSHIAMIAFGIVSLELNGAAGAGLQMAGHAIATGGLFLLVAVMENRNLPDKLRRFGGLAPLAPRMGALALFLTLASLGQPGLGSFPGELLILTGYWNAASDITGSLTTSHLLTIAAALGIILAAAYLLRWYQRVFLGETGTYRIPKDLDGLESAIILVPIALTVWVGVAPSMFLTPIQVWLDGVL